MKKKIKELTPLEALKDLREDAKQHLDSHIDYLNERLDIIETALEDYELMKRTKFIVADKKITDDDLEKLKNQRVFVGSLEQCEIKPLFDGETQKKLKALEIIKEHIIVKSHADYAEFYLEFSLPKHGKGMTQNREKIKLLKEALL